MKNIEILHIYNTQELLKYKSKILKLFKQCFNKTLDSSLWEWAYINNPLGSSVVNLALIDNELVGHYAFIPLKTTKYKTLLSMTTMVAPHSRKHNVFLELAEKSYLFAKSLYFDVIIGFPNEKSAIIHEKVLNWKLSQTFVAQCDINTFEQHVLKRLNINANQCTLDIDDLDFLNWRLSKPKVQYFKSTSNIYKHFNNKSEIDLLTLRNKNIDSYFTNQIKINFITNLEYMEKFKVFHYPFGYKSLNNSLSEYNFYIELLMSDVF